MVKIDEDSNREIRLRDFIDLVLGLAIIIAPWFTGDDASTHGALRIRLLGVCICSVSFWIMAHQRDQPAEWLNAALGAVLASAPLWRGGADLQRMECAVAGAIVVVFSISCALRLAREDRRLARLEQSFRAIRV